MEIKETGTAKKNRVLNMLLYGQPGVGKTTFASYAKNPLIADLERGLTSIVDRNIQYVSVDSVQSFEMAKKIAIEKKYDTFVVDSLTRFCDIAMKDILKKNKKTKPMIADWGELANVVKSMVWDLQSEDISTIFIAHEKITDEDGISRRTPALSGQLSQVIAGVVDVVGYMFAYKDDNIYLGLNPRSEYVAKHRAPFGNKIEKPQKIEISKETDDLSFSFENLKDVVFGEETCELKAQAL